MARLYELVIPVRESTREAFVASRRHPFLLQRRDREEPSEAWTFHTQTISSAAINVARLVASQELRMSPELALWEVFPVTKAGANPWSERISVGRARNNDVVLADRSVSKLHAHFRGDGLDLEVVDVGSRNGTRVNGRRLDTGEAAVVRPGDTVSFGTTTLTLLDAGGLYDLVQRQIETPV